MATRAIALWPDATKIDSIRVLGLEGPFKKPKLLFTEVVQGGESFSDFGAETKYVREEIRRLSRDHGISGMSIVTIDNSAKGKFAVKVTNNVAQRIRWEGFLMGMCDEFDSYLFGRLNDLSKRAGETKVSAAVEHDEFREMDEWAQLPKVWRKLVLAASAVLKVMESKD